MIERLPSGQLINVVFLTLVVGMLLSLGFRGYFAWLSTGYKPTSNVVQPSHLGNDEPSSSDYSVLISQSFLFGEFDPELQQAVEPVTSQAPVTQLNLTLKAVFYQGNGD